MQKEYDNSLPNLKSNAGATNANCSVTQNIESQPTLNSEPQVQSSTTVYSVQDLVRDWDGDKKNPLQQKWGIINSIGCSGSIYFGYCGDSTHEITVTRAVIVYNNMSTKVGCARNVHTHLGATVPLTIC